MDVHETGNQPQKPLLSKCGRASRGSPGGIGDGTTAEADAVSGADPWTTRDRWIDGVKKSEVISRQSCRKCGHESYRMRILKLMSVENVVKVAKVLMKTPSFWSFAKESERNPRDSLGLLGQGSFLFSFAQNGFWDSDGRNQAETRPF